MNDNNLFNSPNNDFRKEILPFVNRFEEMLSQKAFYYFDTDTLEDIFDYYVMESNFEKAEQVANFGIDHNPFSGVFLIKKAQIDLQFSRYEDAIVALDKAEILEKDFDIYFLRHQAHLMSGNTDEAIDNLVKADKLTDEDTQELVQMAFATLYIQTERYDEAIYYLKKTISQDTQNTTALYDICFCFGELKNTDEGIAFFNNLIDQNAYSSDAWYLLGKLHNKAEQFEKAIQAYDYSLAIDDTDTATYLAKGNVYINMEQYQNAVDTFKEGIPLDDTQPLLYCAVGIGYEKMEQYDLAILYYTQAHTIDKTYTDALFGLSVCESFLEQYPQAIRWIEKAIAIEADNAEFWYHFADCKSNLDQNEAALKLYQKSLELDPLYIDCRVDLASLMFELNQTQNANELLQIGMNYHKTEAEYLYRYAGTLLDSKQQTDYAFELLQQALDRDPLEIDNFLEVYPVAINHPEIMKLINQYR